MTDLDHHFPHDSADALGCWALMILCGMVVIIDFPFYSKQMRKKGQSSCHMFVAASYY